MEQENAQELEEGNALDLIDHSVETFLDFMTNLEDEDLRYIQVV